jgi:hypothetical protein
MCRIGHRDHQTRHHLGSGWHQPATHQHHCVEDRAYPAAAAGAKEPQGSLQRSSPLEPKDHGSQARDLPPQEGRKRSGCRGRLLPLRSRRDTAMLNGRGDIKGHKKNSSRKHLACKLAIFALLGRRGTSEIYLHTRRKAATSLDPALHSPIRSTIPTGSQEICSVAKRLVVCRSQGVRGSRVAGWRDIDSPVPRNSANRAIAETERRPGKRGAAAGYRIATNRDP